jgi:hypothetical protein
MRLVSVFEGILLVSLFNLSLLLAEAFLVERQHIVSSMRETRVEIVRAVSHPFLSSFYTCMTSV